MGWWGLFSANTLRQEGTLQSPPGCLARGGGARRRADPGPGHAVEEEGIDSVSQAAQLLSGSGPFTCFSKSLELPNLFEALFY